MAGGAGTADATGTGAHLAVLGPGAAVLVGGAAEAWGAGCGCAGAELAMLEGGDERVGKGDEWECH